ncbi:MAG: hypothetical protein ACI8RN_002994 [Glaciecola sp.]|jgi:hypothetical protein
MVDNDGRTRYLLALVTPEIAGSLSAPREKEMSQFVPTIGRWYQDRESRQLFEIVSMDLDEANVQVQYLDGELADFEFDVWAELNLAIAAAPEDWRTAFELDLADEIDPDAAMHPLQWASPLSNIEPDTVLGLDDL